MSFMGTTPDGLAAADREFNDVSLKGAGPLVTRGMLDQFRELMRDPMGGVDNNLSAINTVDGVRHWAGGVVAPKAKIVAALDAKVAGLGQKFERAMLSPDAVEIWKANALVDKDIITEEQHQNLDQL